MRCIIKSGQQGDSDGQQDDYRSGFGVERMINMTVTRDLGNENYCIKGGQVEVRYNMDDCTVIRLSVDPGNFDCG